MNGMTKREQIDAIKKLIREVINEEDIQEIIKELKAARKNTEPQE